MSDLYAALVYLCDKCLGIGKHILVPDKVTPVRILHPKAIEMKHLKIDASLEHTVYKGKYRLLVVIRKERRRKPKSV